MYFKHFIPSFICIALALFFIRFQSLAVAIVVLGLFSFAVAYAFYVARLIQESVEKVKPAPQGNDHRTVVQSPEFQRVALVIAKKIKLLR